MSRLRQAIREAAFLLVIAAGLGIIYTAATEKGLFARSAGSAASGRDIGKGPVMISRDEAVGLYRADSAVFVDARHRFDFELGHIKGAINLPHNEYDTEKSVLDGIDKHRIVVAYCDGAECNSSIALAARLTQDGYLNVKIFFGGWTEWQEANLPTGKSP